MIFFCVWPWVLLEKASAFPLKWPEEIQVMFEAMSLIGNAGSYMFNPACNDVELVEGESMFFQKQLGILVMPFLAVCFCAIFWFLSGSRDCCDPQKGRQLRRNAKRLKQQLKRQKKLSSRNMKRRARQMKKKAKRDKKALKKLTKKAKRLGKTVSFVKTTNKTEEVKSRVAILPQPAKVAENKLNNTAAAAAAAKITGESNSTTGTTTTAAAAEATKTSDWHKMIDPASGHPNQVEKTTIVNRPDTVNTLSRNYQNTGTKPSKTNNTTTVSESCTEDNFYFETHETKVNNRAKKWFHLNDDHDLEDVTERTDFGSDGNEQLTLIKLTVQPLYPTGIEWEPTDRELERNPDLVPKKRGKKKKQDDDVDEMEINLKLEHKFPAKIKKLFEGKQTQCFNSGLKEGDYLYSVGKVSVEDLSFADVNDLFADAEFVGLPYVVTVGRKVHNLKDRIRTDVMSTMKVNQSMIKTFDKFVATMVTMLYLLYPTVTKATFQLVACQQVGGRLYLQMDLDIACFKAVHMRWVLNLFVPCLLGYVVGLPLMTWLVLYPQRKNLHDKWTRFRFGVLYSGYTDACFYWEVH